MPGFWDRGYESYQEWLRTEHREQLAELQRLLYRSETIEESLRHEHAIAQLQCEYRQKVQAASWSLY